MERACKLTLVYVCVYTIYTCIYVACKYVSTFFWHPCITLFKLQFRRPLIFSCSKCTGMETELKLRSSVFFPLTVNYQKCVFMCENNLEQSVISLLSREVGLHVL